MNDPVPNYSFGYLVRRYRQVLDLTQTELARQVGCALITISKIERDERRPSRQMAGILAERLHIPEADRALFIAAALGERAVDNLSLGATPVAAQTDLPHRRSHNLPAQTTQLIGRNNDLASVCATLLRPEVRLLTLIGPAGAGKTRLSIAICFDLLDHFTDGVFFVPLAPVGEPTLVDSAIADVLGVSEANGLSLRESLTHFLRAKEMLLLLDNFEHLLPAAPMVGELLAAAPRLKILSTSRARLTVYGEHTHPVTPLSLPEAHNLPSTEDALQNYDACRLFLERAQAIKSGFNLTEENVRAVAEICIRLDGLPLAIELAAARARLLPPRKMLERLTSRLHFLTRGAADAPVRHRTLRATIDWSYELLERGEQVLFMRLALFAGGCTLEAAEVVGNIGGDIDVLSALESLMDKSLLVQDTAGDEPRFGMMETFGEYGLERLHESGTSDELHRAYVHYYLQLAEAVNALLHEGTSETAIATLETERNNLRAALRWTYDHGKAGLSLRMVGALWRFWQVRGSFSEGRRHLEAALAIPGDGEPKWRAEAHSGAGTMAFHLGQSAIALTHHEAALALYRKIGDQSGEALALNNLGVQVKYRQGHEQAMPYFEHSLAIARSLDDKTVLAMVFHNLADVARLSGEHDRATVLLGESLDLCRAMGHAWGEAHNLIWLAHAKRKLQEYEGAAANLREGLRLSVGLNAVELIAECLEGSAAIAADRVRPEEAARLWGAAEALREVNGMPLPADERSEYEQDVAAARATLGNLDFAAAWAEGRQMTIEQAATLAHYSVRPMK